MKCLAILIFAVAVAVQAKPFYGMGMGRYGMGGYGSGGSYGSSGYGRGHNGYSGGGYGSNMLHSGHNIGHEQNDYDAAVHHHQSEGHDIGGMTQGSFGGHNMAGYGGYGRGHNGYGSDYQHGFY